MKRFAATLVAEGISDQALLPIIELLLDRYCNIPHITIFAHGLPSGTLTPRIARAMDLYPCDMLFVHRDADRSEVIEREREIRDAAAVSAQGVTTVCIVPMRMTETWLLIDESAIRRAVGNPAGKVNLNLPAPVKLESLVDPKTCLFEALKRASELPNRRLKRVDCNQSRRQVSGFMDSCEPLQQLPSFKHLEAQVRDYFFEAG